MLLFPLEYSNIPQSLCCDFLLHTTLIQIHLPQIHNSRPQKRPVSRIQHHKDNQADIRGEEAHRVPRGDKRRESLRDDNQTQHGQSIPRQVRLEWCHIGQRGAFDALQFQGCLEANVAQVDARPANQAGYRGDVEEPVESLGAVGAEVEEAEEAESRSDKDGNVWGLVLICGREELRGLADVGEGDKDTGAGVDVGVGGGENSGEEDGVDDVWEDGNVGEVRGDDERGGGGAVAGAEQVGVVVRDQQAEEENEADEEEENTPESVADRHGDGLVGVLCLACTYANELGALVGKCSGDEDVPKGDEFAGRFGHLVVVWGECARGDPVLEAHVALVAGTCVDADGKDDEADDGDDLDAHEPDLHFTKDLGGKEVGCSE